FGQFEDVELVACGNPLPAFDTHISLSSLPRVLGINATNIPAAVPYLRPPGDRAKRWEEKIPRDGQLNVGLVWAGSQPHREQPRTRSVHQFARLGRVGGVRFVSLQVGPAAKQERPRELRLLDFTGEIHDFADTAAL